MTEKLNNEQEKQEQTDKKKVSPFDHFLTCWVHIPQSDVSINLPDLLTYSAMSYSKGFGKYPNNGQLGWKTGINRQTIPAIIDRLKELGLVEGRTPIDKEHWFKKTKSGNPMFWKCLIRKSDSPLTFSTTCVFSYLYYRVNSNWQPKNGWSIAYLAACLQLANQTVSDALDTLKKYNLLFIEGDDWLMPAILNDSQKSYFIAKEGEAVKPAGKGLRLMTADELKERAAQQQPQQKMVEQKSNPTPMLFCDYMEETHGLCKIQDYDHMGQIIRTTRTQKNWVENWKRLVDIEVEKLKEKKKKKLEEKKKLKEQEVTI